MKDFFLPLVFFCNLSSAQLTLTISPINGDPESYLLQASGTGDTVSSSINNGLITTDDSLFIAFDDGFGTPSALFYGGESVSGGSVFDGNQYLIFVANNLSSGSAYSFSGGAAIGSLSTGFDYASTFIPGSYTITGSDGIFGPNATGTIEILSSPIPETSAFPFLLGIGALGWTLTRRRASTGWN